MAAPGKDESKNVNIGETKTDSTANVDVTSAEFDPLNALYASDASIPYPNVEVFKNLYDYERKMSGEPDKAKPSTSRSTASTKTKLEFRREGAAPMAMKSEPESQSKFKNKDRTRTLQNILTRMEKLDLKGPLNLLQKCVQEKHYVRVWTRSAVAVRGVCKGYVVAFDKHFNLAMVDVDEVFRNPTIDKKQRRKLKEKSTKEEKAGEEPSQVSTDPHTSDILTSRTHPSQLSSDPRLGRSSVETEQRTLRHSSSASQQSSKDMNYNPVLLCESVWFGVHPAHLLYRHINQVFLRGDNVVSVNIIQR